MANYTAPNYTPKLPEIADYQSTIPLELMGKVGMAKEQQYLVGEQQLQSAVDKINQYPITKDVDRQVIHKKMSELVNNLNSYSGQDLGDSKVLNNLLGYTSSVYNDEDVHQRLVSNMWDAEQIKKIQKTKDENPDEYNPLNEQDYLMEREKWLNNPDQKNFKYTYKPAYNDHEENMDLINTVLKNPDIQYKIDSYGNKRMYTPQELKEVKAQKILEVLSSGRSSRAKAQDALEYKVLLQSPQYGLKSAITEVTGQILEHQNNLKEAQEILKTTKNPTIRKQAEIAIENNTKILMEDGATLENLQKSGDPSEYYTFGKFMHSKLDGIAKGFAYKQEGKLEESQFALEALKQKNRKELLNLKIKAHKELNLEQAPVNVFKNNYLDLKAKGEALFTPEQVYTMSNFAGKIQTDGSIDAVLGGQKQVIDFARIASSIPGLSLNKQKADGWNKYLTEYTKWTNTPEGMNPRRQVVQIIPGQSAQHINQPESPKSIQEFGQYLASNKGITGSKLEDFMKEYKFNPTNDEDVNKVQKIVKDPSLFEALKATTKLLDDKTKIKGTVNLIPQDGVNTIVSSSGKVYNNFYLRVPKKELVDRLNGSNIPASFETNTYPTYDAGVNTGKPNKEFGTLQLVPLSVEVSKNFRNVNAELVNKDKVLSKHAGAYDEDFLNADALEARAREINKYSDEDILNKVNEKIPLFVSEGLNAQQGAAMINSVKTILEKLKNKNLDSKTLLGYKAYLNAFFVANNTKQFNSIVDDNDALLRDLKVSKKETDFMSKNFDVDSNEN